jgi:hypothetical protein
MEDNKKYGVQARGKDWVQRPKDGVIQVLVFDTEEEAQVYADRVNEHNKKYYPNIPLVVKEYKK